MKNRLVSLRLWSSMLFLIVLQTDTFDWVGKFSKSSQVEVTMRKVGLRTETCVQDLAFVVPAQSLEDLPRLVILMSWGTYLWNSASH